MSIHFLSRTGTLIDEFGFGFGFATSFPVLMNSSTFSVGISSDVSVTYLLIPFHNANPWNCSAFKQGFDHDIFTITSIVRIDFHIQGLGRFSFLNESALSVGMFSSLEVVCISRHAIWINLRSFFNRYEEWSFLISFKKPASEHSFDNFWLSGSSANFLPYSCNKPPCADDVELWDVASALVSQSVSPKIHKSHFQYDFESRSNPLLLLNLWKILHTNLPLLRRYWADWQKNRAKNQFNGFFAPVEVHRLLTTTFALLILLFPRHWWHEIQDDRILQKLSIIRSAVLSHSPFGSLTWVPYHFFSQPSPRYDQHPCGNLLANVATFTEFAFQFSSLPGVLHIMSSHMDMKMTLTWTCSGSHFYSAIIFWISVRTPNIVKHVKIVHSNSIGSPSIRLQFFEIACFQIPFNFVFPSLDWCTTDASQT